MAKNRSGNPAVRNAAPSSEKRAIMVASNAPWTSTGYGQQCAQLITRLQGDGHKCAVAVNYGLEGTTSAWNGIPLFPRGFALHSEDVVPAYVQAWAHQNPGLDPLLITLYDVWVFKGEPWDHVPQIAPWVPIDHYPVPPAVMAFLSKPNVTPIAMSQFGQQAILDAGIKDCLYVPHAIDTKVFRPTRTFSTPQGTMTGREFMGIDDDRFVVGMVSANKGAVPNRKSFPESFQAFARFAQTRPDAALYVHTESRPSMGGIDLLALAQACGIREDQIKFPDPFVLRMGVPNEVMAAIYTSIDVLLQPSMGEGFGIPLVEAQACGTPAIVSDATAQPELLGVGWLVEGQPWWDPMQSSWLHQPFVDSIVGALEDAHSRPRERSEKAIEFAAQYDADLVFDASWRPTIKALA